MASYQGTNRPAATAEFGTPAASPLTREKILVAAEEVILRHGAAKATVVDVARVLGVSHANVYKFFADKADLRLAVVRAWLDRMDAPLEPIAKARGAPEVRVKQWLDAFIDARRRMWREDPARFLALHGIAVDQPPAVWAAYKVRTRQSLGRIIAEGMTTGAFRVKDAEETAYALVDACVRFYHPALYREWVNPQMDSAYETLWRLLLAGLRSGPA